MSMQLEEPQGVPLLKGETIEGLDDTGNDHEISALYPSVIVVQWLSPRPDSSVWGSSNVKGIMDIV
jgi:hypothetical protein